MKEFGPLAGGATAEGSSPVTSLGPVTSEGKVSVTNCYQPCTGTTGGGTTGPM